MSKKTAASLNGALTGGASGAAIGTSILPGWGTAIGGAVGAVGGGIAGYMGADADEEAMKNDPEYQAAKRRERTMQMMSAALGRAFKSATPKTMEGVMKRGV